VFSWSKFSLVARVGGSSLTHSADVLREMEEQPRKPYRYSFEEKESAEAKQAWLEVQKVEWEKNQQAREKRFQLQQHQGLPAAPTEPDDAALKREWLRRRRHAHEAAMSERENIAAASVDRDAPLVEASLLSTPSERELYLRSLQDERSLAQRERRRMSTDAARRPSFTAAGGDEQAAMMDLMAASASATEREAADLYSFNYGEHGRPNGCGTSAPPTSSTTAERTEADALEDLEALEALRLQELQQHRRPSGSSSSGSWSPRASSSRPASAHHRMLSLSAGILPSGPPKVRPITADEQYEITPDAAALPAARCAYDGVGGEWSGGRSGGGGGGGGGGGSGGSMGGRDAEPGSPVRRSPPSPHWADGVSRPPQCSCTAPLSSERGGSSPVADLIPLPLTPPSGPLVWSRGSSPTGSLASGSPRGSAVLRLEDITVLKRR
jgi:hypothetical protein